MYICICIYVSVYSKYRVRVELFWCLESNFVNSQKHQY